MHSAETIYLVIISPATIIVYKNDSTFPFASLHMNEWMEFRAKRCSNRQWMKSKWISYSIVYADASLVCLLRSTNSKLINCYFINRNMSTSSPPPSRYSSTRRSNEYSLMKHQRPEPLVYSFKVLISDFFTQSPSNWISNHRLVNEKFHGRKVTFKCLNSLLFHVFYGPSCNNIANEQRSSPVRVHHIDQVRTLESVERLNHPTFDVTYLHKWPSPHYSTCLPFPSIVTIGCTRF